MTFSLVFLITFFLFQLGCQTSYILHNAWEQSRLMAKRVPLDQVLKDPKASMAQKKKLLLVTETRIFAEKQLGLVPTKNYTQFVELNRPYVTYVLHVAPIVQLESYLWWFPLIGHVPYKGFFSLEEALKEAQKFPSSQFDTYVRGVTAYSTLGWFQDPLWSSMLNYADHDLVQTIIHETVHATLYIKGQADFNEKLATFLGDYGTELFFRHKEGENSATLELIRKERQDQDRFSQFLSQEIKDLGNWYKEAKTPLTQEDRQKKFREIQNHFQSQVAPYLQTSSFIGFQTAKINNAYLLSLGTYYENLEDFDKVKKKMGSDFKVLLAYFRHLEKVKNPDQELKTFVSAYE